MSSFLIACNRACGRVVAVVRQVIGAPDYQRYVAHVRLCHPGAEPVGWDEFYRARLEDRYSKPGAKCC
ncbi:MAG: YbdD/YjiX family protein [Gemmatimonadota bacterium]|nr:YbdD/YjiX family protein [Gemmatimonadota bacterium]